MYPIIYTYERFVLYSYGTCIGLGALFAYCYILSKSKEFELNTNRLPGLLVIITVSAYIGGKLFSNLNYFLAHPAQIFRIYNNGFVFYGGLIFTLLTLYIYFRIYKMNMWLLADLAAICLCIIQIFGKLGCLMAGCCYGKPTNNHLLSITFINKENHISPLNISLHPTQIYEMSLALVILIILLRLNKDFNGQLMLIYLCIYSLGRFVVEIYRGDAERGFVLNGLLSQSQLISIVVFFFTLIIYVFRIKRLKAI
jgi:phosphatidylglycerol:prolipoprotein diacylglycerol transferase